MTSGATAFRTTTQADHGSSDGEVFTVVKRGLPPTMMPGFGGQLSDEDIWRLVHYLHALRTKK